MSDSNSTVSPDTDNLDDFEALLNGKAIEGETSKAIEEEVDEEDTSEDDTLAETVDEAVPEDEVLDEEPAVKEKPKSRFQERIDELTAKAREAERREIDLRADFERKLAKLEDSLPKAAEKIQAKASVTDGAPDPDDLDANGEDKYPLGKFDPAFIVDLTRHSFKVIREEAKAAEAEEKQATELQTAQAALDNQWKGRLETAKEKYPDMIARNTEMFNALEGTDERLGQYLANTIMSMEYGTDVLYYLASNIEEAKKIVNSGATSATLALGRLEAKFASTRQETQEPKVKVSKAPEPPARVNKGSLVSKEIPDDTDDLDAFANKLFNGKSKRW